MILGIDIGGTTINLGLVEGTEIVKKKCVPSFRKGASQEETLIYLYSKISEIINPDVERIGVGVPTLVDSAKGIVYNAANIPSWDVVPLKEKLEFRYHLPAAINNDANCFVLGAAAKLPKKYSMVVGITLGTGTGVGIVADGNLLVGANCGAGEMGSIAYGGDIYETYCSKKFFTDRGTTPLDAFTAAEAGDAAALGLFREFGAHLGKFLAAVLYAYDPDCVIIGGGLSQSSKYFKEPMMLSLKENYMYPKLLEKLEVPVMPDADIPLLGASLLK